MTKNNESLELFKLNSTDKIRVMVEQNDLKNFNEINNDNLSIDIISNAYENFFFFINDRKYKDLKFKFLPEITIFQKEIIFHFFNREKNITINIPSSEEGKIFKIISD